MADTDLLPSRGVTFEALVDSTGVAINGSSTVAQLAAKGMRAACAVDGTGTAITGGGSLAQIAAAGIRAFCAVDQNGVAQDASTADQLRSRGIRPRVLLDATGVALNGSAGQAVLASRGLTSFCPVDESGNATTMGAVILISNTNVFDNIAVGATVGTLSVAGGSGTYTFTLTSNPGAHFATAGTNGVNLNTATALTAGSYPVTVQAAGGVPTPISRPINITVSQAPTLPANTAIPVISGLTQVGQTLTTTDGTWTGFPTPGFTYQWKRGGSAISGATGNTYLLVSADTGTTITVTVTATNSAGNASATSGGVGPITAPAVNYSLTCQTGAFVLTGDSMTPTAGLSMSAGSGAFTLAGTGIPQVLLWTPANLPNLIAWYKADVGVYSDLGTTAAIDGAAVVQWNDQSPNHYHLVQNDSNPHQPILHKTGWTGGKPALYFDQTPPNGNQMMSGPVAMGSGSPFSAFAVAEMEATTGSNGRVLSYGPPAGPDYSAGGAVLISRSGATAVMGTYRNGPTATIPLAYATNAHIGFVGDGSITTGYINNSTTGGTPANPDNSTFTTGGNIGVGGQISGGTMSYASNWQGYIAEVVLTNAALSPADRASLEAYFSARW